MRARKEDPVAFISGLYIYPVKSCQGIQVSLVDLTLWGPWGDREFAIVGPDGAVFTQRTHPHMAEIRTSLSPDTLVMRVPGQGALSVSLRGPAGARRPLVVWDDRCEGGDMGDTVACALAAFLGEECRLLRYLPDSPRLRESTTLGRVVPVAFADCYPLLVISEASLADLNCRCPEQIPMDRFRPNIVVGGVEAYAEDAVAELVVGAVHLEGANQCTRCAVTTTDQRTGARGVEPLRTLATYRRNADGKVVFGRNFAVGSRGRLYLGDEVRLVASPA